MTANTSETLSRGMAILTENMGLVEAENFIFLVKTEGFDYTQWQRNYFGDMTREQIDQDMDLYFAAHPYRGDPSRIV